MTGWAAGLDAAWPVGYAYPTVSIRGIVAVSVASLTTRLARPDDAAAIAEIYNQGIEERIATFETEPRTPEQIVAALAERGEHFPTVVAERSGQIIAWAAAGSYRSRPCYAGIGEYSVYVHRLARGTGAGKVVLEALFTACEARGIWKLVSRIFPENVASLALCRATGFQEVGVYRRHAKLDGEWRDCVIVEKLLGEAAADHDQLDAEPMPSV
jgi:L-amino acid N-acyltransferase YncA